MVDGRGLLLIAVALLRAAPAFAQGDGSTDAESAGMTSADAARAAFNDGLRHLRAEQWAEAEAAFRRSLELVPRASTRYNLALVLFKQRRVRESLVAIDALLAAPPEAGDERHHAYAKTLRPLVLAELGRLTLHVEPGDARLEIDGEAVATTGSSRSVWIDPGPHRIHVSAPGHAPQNVAFRIERGQERKQEIKLIASVGDAPPARPAERMTPARFAAVTDAPRRPRERSALARVAPWVTIGTGSVLLAGGVVSWLRAKRADDDFTDACPTLIDCDPALEEKQEDAQRYARLGTVLLATGGVLVAGGIVWQVVTPASQSGNNTSGAWFVSARGRF